MPSAAELRLSLFSLSHDFLLHQLAAGEQQEIIDWPVNNQIGQKGAKQVTVT